MPINQVPTREPINEGGEIRNIWAIWFQKLRDFVNLIREELDIILPASSTEDNLLWDDLRFPAQGINPVGSAEPPSVSTTTGHLEFSGTTDNVITGIAQLPHAWKAGTSIMPHIHIRNFVSNSQTSRWKFEYDIANRNGNFSQSYGNYTTLATVSHVNPANTAKHSVVSFGNLTMTGYTESCIIIWKLTRLAASDVLDNDNVPIALMELDFHYQKNKDGTQTVYRP